MKILDCDIMFCKNKADDYHCCVQWSESPLTAYDDGEIPSFKRHHNISKSKLRSIFNHLRQSEALQEIKVSRYKYGGLKMRKVRYIYVLN